MDAFVALTGLDETNIILAMYASQLNHCKVVAKINRKSFADVVTERGLVDSLVSTGAVTTELIVQYVRAMQHQTGAAVTLHRIADGRAEALEFIVNKQSKYIGEPLKNLRLTDQKPKEKKKKIIHLLHGKHLPAYWNQQNLFRRMKRQHRKMLTMQQHS